MAWPNNKLFKHFKNKNFQERIRCFSGELYQTSKEKAILLIINWKTEKEKFPNSCYKDHHSRKENRLIALMKTGVKILKETLISGTQQYIKELWDSGEMTEYEVSGNCLS